MRNVVAMMSFAMGVVACSPAALPLGPVAVQLIQPSGAGCTHTIAPATLTTLSSLATMSGSVGRVAHTTKTLTDTTDLQNPTAFQPVSAGFSGSGDVYYPMDYDSLYAASLYYAIERAYLLHRTLTPEMDAAKLVPSFSQTLILLDPEIIDAGSAIEDNAAYIPVYFSNSQKFPMNVFASFPYTSLQEMPLGLNTGVIGHEFTHLIFHHLVTVPVPTTTATPKLTTATLTSLDEGIADYFGFLTSKDPSFFLCSFPTEDRDLLKPRSFDASFASRIRSANYDVHEGGAIFASINYEIGKAIGHETNGRTLHQLMRNLNGCVQPNSREVTFADVARCHISAAGSAGAQMRAVYGRLLGPYGAGL